MHPARSSPLPHSCREKRWPVAGTFPSSRVRAAQYISVSLPPLGRTETRRPAQRACSEDRVWAVHSTASRIRASASVTGRSRSPTAIASRPSAFARATVLTCDTTTPIGVGNSSVRPPMGGTTRLSMIGTSLGRFMCSTFVAMAHPTPLAAVLVTAISSRAAESDATQSASPSAPSPSRTVEDPDVMALELVPPVRGNPSVEEAAPDSAHIVLEEEPGKGQAVLDDERRYAVEALDEEGVLLRHCAADGSSRTTKTSSPSMSVTLTAIRSPTPLAGRR